MCPGKVSEVKPGTNRSNIFEKGDLVMRVKGRINGVSVICLIDTGASRCFLKKTIWDQIKTGELRQPVGKVATADNRTLSIMGTCDVTVTVNEKEYPVEVSVCRDLVEDCVLGCNFLRMNRAVCVPYENFIELKGQRVEEYNVPPSVAVLCETVLIPARSEVIGRVKLDGEAVKLPRVVEPSSRCWEKFGCLIGRGVISGNEGGVLLRNSSNENVTLRQNTRVGTAYVCTVLEEEVSFKDRPTHKAFNWDEASKYLTPEQLRRAKKCIDEHRSAVSLDRGDKGRTTVLQHHIDTGNAPPIRMAPRRLPLGRREEAQKRATEDVTKGSDKSFKIPLVFSSRFDTKEGW